MSLREDGVPVAAGLAFGEVAASSAIEPGARRFAAREFAQAAIVGPADAPAGVTIVDPTCCGDHVPGWPPAPRLHSAAASGPHPGAQPWTTTPAPPSQPTRSSSATTSTCCAA